MSFTPFIDARTGRTVTRTSDDSRYLLGPKFGPVDLFESDQPDFAFEGFKDDDVLRWRDDLDYPARDAFCVYNPEYPRQIITSLTPHMVQRIWAQLERQDSLSGAEVKQRMLATTSAHIDLLKGFGYGDEEIRFYLSRAVAEAWHSVKKYVEG